MQEENGRMNSKKTNYLLDINSLEKMGIIPKSPRLFANN